MRDVAWVLDSFERLVRKNPLSPTKLFATPEERQTVYSRVEALAHRDRVVGFAWSALKEAYYGEHSRARCCWSSTTSCASARARRMRLVYEFLGEPWHEHDFDQVEYDEPEFDAQLGAPGLHSVKTKVEFTPRRTVLPPDLFEKYATLAFWRDPKGSAAWRITAQPDAQGGLQAGMKLSTRRYEATMATALLETSRASTWTGRPAVAPRRSLALRVGGLSRRAAH